MKGFGVYVMLFCFFISPVAFSDKIQPECSTDDWKCHDSFYLTGGGAFAHVFYKNNILSITPPNQSSATYNPADNFPNNFFGMRFGFSSGLGKKTPFYYELDYQQTFTKSKINPQLNFDVGTKLVVGTVGYVINPKSRLRAALFGGATVIAVNLTTSTVSPRAYYSIGATSVDVDPIIGGSLTYQINSKFAVRLVEFYDIAPYNKNLSGRALTLLMLNYYPS